MTMRTSLILVPVLLALGCAHQEKKNDSPQAGTLSSSGATPAQSPPAKIGGAGDQTCNSDIECGAKQLCIRNHCVDISAGLAECSSVRIHFDFNASELRPEERPALERMSRCLKADHAMHVTVEGNADERGTQEYNLALGDRRATAVAKYLELLGASQGQLKTVSYGKENPLCTEHDEECWSKNRAAALKPKEAKR
jgi:peptidoglycan-associated lipoprotein